MRVGPGPAREEHQEEHREARSQGTRACEALNGFEGCGLSCSVWSSREEGVCGVPGPTALRVGTSPLQAWDSDSPPFSTSSGGR